jgi:uncharacterized membrane protein (UPF0127 family)
MHQKRIQSISMLVCLLCMATRLPMMASAQVQQEPPWRVAPQLPPERAEMSVGKTSLDVELAVTTNQQTLGLGYRNGLAPGTGMLFVDTGATERTFWMKGMRFCLDIVWVQDGKIVGAAENACPDPDGTADQDRARFASPGAVTYVLEVPAGWLKQYGYGTGTVVVVPDNLAP